MIKKATLIAGPTASGKSSLALQIARARDGIIINADALQVYEAYQVLTARPSAEDLRQAPHELYGHLENTPGYSVGEWLKEIKQIIDNNVKYPIIVGGTGLYFKALLNGLAVIPPTSDDVKSRVETQYQSEGLEALKAKLETVDPEIYARIDLQNHRRVMRALEVFEETGKPLSAWQKETPPPLLERDDCEAIIVCPDVETTNLRIENRFKNMMSSGAVEEVRRQLPFDPKLPANQALGAVEIAQYLQGEINENDAIERSIIVTRQYAKRQRTWFRSNMKDWEWRPNPE